MKLEQLKKIILVMIIATVLMLLFDIIFQIDSVSDGLSNWIIGFQDKIWLLYCIIFLIMFLQVIIPIPAVVILNAALQIGIIKNHPSGILESDFWTFILITLSAYMLGAIAAYLLGYKYGRKAVKWCAGSDEDYEKWSTFLRKKGKWYYAASVILPIFPDDLLCICAGAIKFDFPFFFFSNLIGRGVGLITMLFTLSVFGISEGFPISAVVWAIALVGLLTVYYHIIKKERKGF